jgi:acyl CoA:acetate/3-ketoacid CoA transferase beta subunit
MANAREVVAKRIARIFKAGDVVNLGIGMPTVVANYLPAGVNIMLH